MFFFLMQSQMFTRGKLSVQDLGLGSAFND